MTNGKRIKQITNGAIIAAIYAIFLMISRFTGSILEYQLFFLMPVPLAIYSYKYDWKVGIIPLTATTIISFFACANPLNAFIYVMPALFIGLLQGGILSKLKMKAIYIILISAMFAMLTEVLSSVVLASVLGIEDIFAETQALLENMWDLAIKLNIDEGIINIVESVIKGLIPSVIIILGLIDGMASYLFFYVIVLRMKMLKIDDKPVFERTRFPKWLGIVYLVLFAASVYLIATFLNYVGSFKIVVIVTLNIFIIFSLIYLYFGVQISSLYIRVINKRWMILLIYALVFFAPYVLISIGVVDNLIDLKQKIIDFYYKKQNEQK